METEDHDLRRKLVQQNQRLLQNLNTQRHCSCEVRQLVSEIIGQKIAASTEIRLPFYSDYGHNIKLGERVFINANVMMVDLGGITIENDVLIGPGAYLISVNHKLDPQHRKELELKPVVIKQNARIGANATILPGVLPSIRLASSPTARMELLSLSMATTEGSRMTMPCPLI